VNKTEQYLKSVYKSIDYRRDSYVELALALASCEQLESVVGLSKSPLYRRSFASVYETLDEVSVDEVGLLKANWHLGERSCAELDGIAVYSGDSSFIRRTEAKTFEGRVMKRLSNGALVYGYESYWSMRLADEERSWTAVMQAERMAADESVSTKAKAHIQALDALATSSQLYVMDAGHGKDVLAIYPECKHTDMIMRVKSNQVFYFEPKTQKALGRPRLHGARFKLDDTATQPEPERSELMDYKGKPLRIQTWSGLHYQAYAKIKGRILKLEFLNDEGKTVFDKPIWLFTTNPSLRSELIARAYLWRSSHELSFRFIKQHLGLKLGRSPEAKHADNWLRLVMMAMNLLLAAKDSLAIHPDPWYPQQAVKPISQRQAQKQALPFFLSLDTPTKPTRPAGKGLGRQLGFKPQPRIHYPIIRKTPKNTKHCKSCACFST